MSYSPGYERVPATPQWEAGVRVHVPKEVPTASEEAEDFTDPSGKYKLVMKGAYAAVECAVLAGDSVKAETGAMVAMSSNVDLFAKIEGSTTDAIVRCCCAGEGLFMSHFTLKPNMGQQGYVLLAPAVPGHISLLHLDGREDWAIQKSSFLACDPTVGIRAKVQGFAQGCCSGEGFFILKAVGTGRLLVNTYGGLLRYELEPGETLKIENGFIVCWHEHMNYTINKSSKSLVSSFLSGEAFVCTFTGPGVVFVQTRSVKRFAARLPRQADLS